MHEVGIRQDRRIQQLELRHIRQGHHHRSHRCQEGDGQVSDHEEAFVTGGIEPEESGHEDEDRTDGPTAKQYCDRQAAEHADTAQSDTQMHGGGFANRARHDDFVRAVDTVYLDIEIIVDDIPSGRYQDAISLLSRMTSRGAAWHYLNALASQGLGQRVDALNHARQAVQLDPSNAEYQSLLRSLQGSGGFYQSRGGQRSFGDSICSNPCATIIGINILLNCLCGRPYFMCC